MTAYWKQISCGPYDPEKYPDVGYFDVIGNDRRLERSSLIIFYSCLVVSLAGKALGLGLEKGL